MADRALVRPRVLWAGVGLLVAGLVAVGVAMMADSEVTEITGLVAVVVGAVLAWRGGILYDAGAARPPAAEVEDVRTGRVHEGTPPGAREHDPAAVQHAAVEARRTRSVLGAAQSVRAPLQQAGAVLLLLLALWLMVGQHMLGDMGTSTGQATLLRDEGFGIVIVASGLRLLLGPPSRAAVVVAFLAGVLLILAGLLERHVTGSAQVSETVTGCLVVVVSLLPLRRPTSR